MSARNAWVFGLVALTGLFAQDKAPMVQDRHRSRTVICTDTWVNEWTVEGSCQPPLAG